MRNMRASHLGGPVWRRRETTARELAFSLGFRRLLARPVKSLIHLRIRRNSNRLMILYNDQSFIGVGFVRRIFADFAPSAIVVAEARDGVDIARVA
jgi:hypothetical protein